MRSITTEKISKEHIDNWRNLFEYHCTYILENGKEAYIGQTTDIEQRIDDHMRAVGYIKKYDLKTIHVISGKTGDGFSETPSKHFEYLLIKLMKADNKFRILNKKPVKLPHYDQIHKFEKFFDEIWGQLVEKKLVKKKVFATLINSAAYKYSPDTILNQKQQDALTATINAFCSKSLDPSRDMYNNRVILVNGSAGTGKSVFATSLLHYLKTNEHFKDKKVALVYSQPSMRTSIKNAIKVFDGLTTDDVIAPIEITKDKNKGDNKYDILICDEAHRLRCKRGLGIYGATLKRGNENLGFGSSCDELDWILENSKYQVLIYDSNQIVVPADIDSESFESRIGKSSATHMHRIRRIYLDEQMRIRAGGEYISYVYDLFNGKPGIKKRTFENYDFRLIDNLSDMVNLIHEKEKSEGISRLCSGYAWKWEKGYPLNIDGVELWWNSKTNGWLDSEKLKNEIGSIYTLSGLDLNFAGVMIGPDLVFDKESNSIQIDESHIFDTKVRGVKNAAAQKAYILNSYAVLMTRGIMGTFVYIHDKELREYFRKFI